MPTVLKDALLDAETTTKSRIRRRLMVATIAALVLSVGYVSYSVGRNIGEVEMNHDAVYAKIASIQNARMNQTELAVVPYSETCYGFTGGTCMTSPCKEGRESTCVDGKCSCTHGCTNGNGVCQSSTYKKVGSSFSLTNGYWSHSWLYVQRVSALGQLMVSGQPSAFFMGAQNFDLFELPGRVKGKKQYFLASAKWPSWVMAIRHTGSVLQGGVSPWGLYAVNLVHTIAPWDPQDIIVQVCSLRNLGFPNEIMIGSSGASGHTEWAYVHRGSYFVYGWGMSGDPGSGGYWIPSAMPKGLEAC